MKDGTTGVDLCAGGVSALPCKPICEAATLAADPTHGCKADMKNDAARKAFLKADSYSAATSTDVTPLPVGGAIALDPVGPWDIGKWDVDATVTYPNGAVKTEKKCEIKVVIPNDNVPLDITGPSKAIFRDKTSKQAKQHAFCITFDALAAPPAQPKLGSCARVGATGVCSVTPLPKGTSLCKVYRDKRKVCISYNQKWASSLAIRAGPGAATAANATVDPTVEEASPLVTSRREGRGLKCSNRWVQSICLLSCW